jgi:hypothetical protein
MHTEILFTANLLRVFLYYITTRDYYKENFIKPNEAYFNLIYTKEIFLERSLPRDG